MQGKIIKGIAGFYYVQTEESGLYECKAKGIFRKEKIKPLVGDNVELSVTDEEKKTGNVDEILPRKNTLIRPAVANIDQVLVIFAAASPKPNLNLLDRFLVSMDRQGVPAVICFNKQDCVDQEERTQLKRIYENSGCKVLFTCARTGEGIADVRSILEKVVSEGSGRNARIEGCTVGGKTATSQTLPRSANRYISSFLGFMPAEDPQILGLCIIHDPQGVYYGGAIAAPVIKNIFEAVLERV